MVDIEAPPLSAPIGHFRLEVSKRATRFAQRRRRRVAGGVGAAVLLVALAASVVGVEAGHPGARRTVAGPTTTIGREAGGPFGLNRPKAGSTADAAPDVPQPPTPAGSTSVPILVVDPPDGTASSVQPGRKITVVLAAPATGRWSGAVITKGKGSVLALVRQVSEPQGGVRVTFQALTEGVADVRVPVLGQPATSWHGTVEVTGRATPSG